MNGFDLETAPDIAAIEEEGITIHLRDEKEDLMYFGDDDPKTGHRSQPVTWTVVGSYSDTHRKAARKLRKLWGQRAKTGDEVQSDDDDAMLAAQCSRGFVGFFAGGKPIEFTRANAQMILASSKAQHILKQVSAAVVNHERFFGTPSKS